MASTVTAVRSTPDARFGARADAEASASGAPRPPEITMTEHDPPTVNDPERTEHVAPVLREQFGDARVHELAAPVSAGEDFGSFGTAWGVPSVFWYVGGTDPDAYRAAQDAGRVAQDIPTNHNARFAPSSTRHWRPACRP